MNVILTGITFVLVAILTLVLVLFFFEPVSAQDNTSLEFHPVFGFLVYVSLCVGIFEWGRRELTSPYKAAVVVAAPQIALIVDLVLRGARGPVSGGAGVAMLLVIWAVVASCHGWLSKRLTRREGA